MNDRVGGLASRVDCNGKGVKAGKSVIMNVGLQFNSTRRRRRRKRLQAGKEVGMLIFLVRNVRFGSILVGRPSAKDRLCLCLLYSYRSPVVPPNQIWRLVGYAPINEKEYYYFIIIIASEPSLFF